MTDIVAKPDYSTRAGRLMAEAAKLPQVHCPVRNFFAPGIYMREMTIPAGIAIVGAAHRHEHYCVVTKGRIRVTTEDTEKVFVAGDIILSQPGDQRCGFAEEETVWITVHHNPDNITDLSELVPKIVFAKESELLGGKDNVQLLTSGEAPCPLVSLQPQ